ncbi:EAL domain-containing protein [Sporomusa malonica]|uniref:Diguanylate cyclase (GGDEF) domain-containing protein n=1 Tax=Sporomusa malonica TaxID=112901 RepID=A0A1W1YFM0_9FIRM|nr:EAL domain-containing protein [Sporomusa malonica]SMC34943.1 diguanylate cyclase (GGDEF) domain-containing protein [Sporomusa malonica]
MSTKYKLAAGYVLIVVVVLISGLLSYGDFVELEQNVDQIQVNHMPSVEALGRMSITASAIQRLLYDLTTEQDSLKIEEARRKSLDIMTEVNSRHMIYSLRYISSLEEQRLFDEVKKAWDKFLPEAKAIASDPWSAARWNDSTQLSQLMGYWQQIDEKIMSLIEYNAAESNKATKDSAELVRAVKGKYLAGASVVIILILIIWIVTSRIITRSEERLYRYAYYDSLTGLPNASHFSENVSVALAKKELVRGGLFYIDLDNFKLINDSYGHDWGNLVLIALVKRVEQVMPPNGIFARLGGDEFAISLPGVSQEEAVAFAKKIVAVMHEPFEIKNTLFFTTTSIGVVLYPEHGRDVAGLLRKADMAMYRAKESGKNSFCLFDSFMEAVVMERLAIESGLRQALVNNELALHYQPIINLADNQVTGFEALLRWNSKDLGSVPPLKFIPVAESTGMIIPIGEWVIRQACGFIKKLHEAGYADLKIAVNISVNQLVVGNVIENVKETLQEFQLEPWLLELEITESILMESSGTSLKQLDELATMGVSLALDDFGTGYSSLTYLRQLPICTLKLDKTFVDNLPQVNNTATRAIVEGIITMAHKLGLIVVAEGVETGEQLSYLYHHSCDFAQGYYISRPIPENEVNVWLINRKFLNNNACQNSELMLLSK